MSDAQRLEQVAATADREARQLRQLAQRLGSLSTQVSSVIGGTATAGDKQMIDHVRGVKQELDRAASALFTGAKEARAAAEEERQRERAAAQAKQKRARS